MSKSWYGTMFGTTTVELHREFKTKFEDDMVDIHREETEKPKDYCDNRVITSKYNVFTFLPRSLFEQFRRVANLYFLFISILMLIGTYTTLYDSPITPYSTLITLVIVLAISMTKEAIEDTKRHKADKQTNHQTTLVLNKYSQSEEWTETKWKDVKVGNIVKVIKNQEIPADLMLLTTSEKMGVAFIETSNIDGETNLKIKNSCRTGGDNGPLWTVASELRNSNLTVQCEQPNSAIHHFNGTLFFSGREVGVDASSLLLRGSSLRNTKHAIGIVVYTGKETKLVMNSRKAPSKLSYIEKTMNTLIYMIFAAQVLISLVSLIAFIVFKNLYYDDLTYLCYNSSGSTNSLFVAACDSSSDYSDAGYFITFFILYNNFIPISLYVTVEMCNYFQAFFIDNDLQLYHNSSDTPALARTSNMNSDLGMVEYIFSDKTGTLTDNVMKFKRCSIAGTVYGDSPFDEDKQEQPQTPSDSLGHVPVNRKAISGVNLSVITSTLTGKNNSTPQAKLFADFVLVLALCHTVIVDTENTSNGSSEQQQQHLVSESPDEEALVKAAQTLGMTFVGRSPGRVDLIHQQQSSGSSSSSSSAGGGVSVSYELLATIPFDSTRKRMSVVIRRPDGSLVVYCKGADNIIFERATHFMSAACQSVALSDSSASKDLMLTHLDCFASDGLRTLILSKKELTEDEYKEFSKLYSKAEKAIVGRDKLTAEAAVLVERGLTVLGATAIEDKLQQGVPSTIADIRAAGIKLWVLTGDKMETAINIGYSSRLLMPNMILIKLAYKGEDAATMRRKLVSLLGHFQKMAENKFDLLRALSDIQHTITNSIFGMLNIKSSDSSRDAVNSDTDGESSSKWVSESVERPAMETEENKPLLDENNDRPLLSQLTSDHLGLIVDGDTLIKIFGDAVSERIFLSLAMICRSVIACRVSPEQKRLIVRLVKKGVHPTPVTLSIGDGANDVAMIQEAQIGVGISGKEGRQAVNNSDFAIAQFRFLKRLLMVHGRLDYRRICKVVVYSFYKNVVLTMVLFAFQFFAGYSGQSLFDDYIYAMYNIVLALPVVAFGIFDRDISESTLLKYNFLYLNGRKRLDLNPTVVVLMLLQAIVEAVIIFFVPYYCYSTQYDIWNSSTNGGYSEGLWVFGTAVYTYLIVSMFVRCGMLTCTWTWITHVCMLGSLLLYFVFILVYQYLSDWAYNFYGVANETLNSSTFWLLFLVVLAGSMMLDATIDMIRREFFPSIVDIGIEFDRHAARLKKEGQLEYDCDSNSLLEPSIFGESRAIRSRQSSRGHLSDHEASSTSPSGGVSQPSNDLSAEEQAALHFSKALSGPNDKQKFALDWFTLKSMFGTLSPSEAENLGVTNTENATQPGASYNYDHVSTGYGPGAGLVYIQNTLQKATNSVFRISGSDRSDVDNDEHKSDILIILI